MTSAALDGGGSDVEVFFDAEAGGYDAAYDDLSPGGYALRARMETTLRLLDRSQGDVLDAGMGAGRLAVELDRRGWNVAGTDLSAEMVTRARGRLPHATDRLVQAPIETIPFADASFDAVIATGVLEYVPDPPAAVAELARVLRPGGLAVVSTPNARSLFGIWRRVAIYPAARVLESRIRASRGTPPPGTRVRRRHFEEILAGAGMDIESVSYVNLQAALTPLDQLFPRAALRLAQRLEGSSPLLGRLLATQLVFAVRKIGTPASAPSLDVASNLTSRR